MSGHKLGTKRTATRQAARDVMFLNSGTSGIFFVGWRSSLAKFDNLNAIPSQKQFNYSILYIRIYNGIF